MNNVKILYVDDTELSLIVCRGFLKDLEHITLITADTPEEGFELIKKEDFALILLDVNMPKISGFELAKMIKEIPEKSEIPIIFLTASDPKLYTVAFDVGAVEFMTKPFNRDILIHKVNIFSQLFDQKIELERANLKKDQLYKKMSQFVGIVSHDLRSPLSSIYTAVNIMMQNELDPEDMNEYLDGISTTCDRALKLVDDFLNIAVLESGTIRLDIEKIDINDLITGVFKELKYSVDQKKINLISDLSKFKLVNIDERRICQVITNLINNAIKFTKPGGDVLVKTRFEGDFIHIVIKDSGIGIAEEIREHLFDKLVATTKVGTNGEYGTGLGLPLAYDIVKLHNSELTFISKKDEGTEFHFALPIAD